jgi:glycosyltransferase involved in cell wall biosynthesis
LGRLVPEKGADILVDALALLRARGVAFRAVIGGDGPQRSALEERIDAAQLQDCVTLRGWVEDSAAFYGEVDVLCVPSRSESFGLIVLEAWQHGVPVVATRADGPSELIASGENGMLADIAPHALADAMAAVLENSPLARRLAEGGRRAVAQYTMQAVAPRLDAVLTSAAGGAG